MKGKLRVAILGTGKIGTDLLIKIRRSNLLTCSIFAGRNSGSDGMLKAQELGIVTSDKGIDGLVSSPEDFDVVVDCTSAKSHEHHWRVCQELGKPIVDMTPAKLGSFCVPVISSKIEDKNINMITCGGQTSIPIAYAISLVHDNIEYIEVASNIASLSAGPATRENLDEYVETTQLALKQFSGAKKSKAILILNPATPPIDMLTTIYAKIHNPKIEEIRKSIEDMVESVRKYVPGYQIVVPPILKDGIVFTTVKVIGAGDYLPQYAGNLDIINCAAIAVLEKMARNI